VIAEAVDTAITLGWALAAWIVAGAAIVTVLLLSIVASWNNYFLPLVMLSDSKLYPLTVGLTTWFNTAQQEGGTRMLFNLITTGALVAIVPLIVAFLLLQRFWRSGLSSGSLK